MSVHDRFELRYGFNKELDKFFFQIVDTDTQDNMKVYLTETDMEKLCEELQGLVLDLIKTDLEKL